MGVRERDAVMARTDRNPRLRAPCIHARGLCDDRQFGRTGQRALPVCRLTAAARPALNDFGDQG